jgi:hypothetical protein
MQLFNWWIIKKQTMQTKQLTDSEKIDVLNVRIKRMEVSQHIQTAIAIIAFLGIVNFGMFLKRAQIELNGGKK